MLNFTKNYLLLPLVIALLGGCEQLDYNDFIPQELLQKSPREKFETEMQRKNGISLITGGDYQGAVRHFDKLIQNNPDDAAAYNGKAVAFDYSGNHLAAQEIYKTALSLDPDSVTTKNNLAMSLILNRNPQEAIKILEPLLKPEAASPHIRTIRQNLALAYGISGQTAKAAELNLQSMSKEQAEQNLRFYEKLTSEKRGTPTAKTIGFINTETIAVRPPQPMPTPKKTIKYEESDLFD